MITPNAAQLFLSPQMMGQGMNATGLGTGMAGLFGSGGFGSMLPIDGGGAEKLLGDAGQQGAEVSIKDIFSQMVGQMSQSLQNAVANMGGVGQMSLTQTTTVVYQELSIVSLSGIDMENISSLEELSDAYEELGLTEEEAKKKAGQVGLLLALMEERLKNGADMSASLLDPQLVSQIQDVMSQDGQNGDELVLKQRSVTVMTTVAINASLNQDLAGRILNGEPLEGNFAATMRAALKSLAAAGQPEVLASSQGQSAGDDGADILSQMQNLAMDVSDKALKAMETALGKMNALQGDEGLPAKEMGEMISLARRLIGDVREGGLEKLAANTLPAQNADADVDTNSLIQSLGKQAANIPANSEQAADIQAEQARLKAQLSAGQTKSAEGEVALEELAPLKEGAADGKKGDTTFRQETIFQSTSVEGKPSPALGSNTPVLGQGEMAAASKPVMVVESAPDGGVQVVDAKTGLVMERAPAEINFSRSEMAQRLSDAATYAPKQLTVHVKTLARHGGGNINVVLSPPELGRLNVNLSIQKGVVEGKIIVQRQDVIEHLARDLKGLEQALTDLGLEIGDKGLSLELSSQDNQGGQAAQDEADRFFAREGAIAGQGKTSLPQGEGIWLSKEKLLDILV